jgi:23S rRNA pseudouridine2605 synthase
MIKERIQKLISESGYCSRRKAEDFIKNGQVLVDGRPCIIGDKCLPTANITVNGEKIPPIIKRKLYYIMLYKPRGYVTTLSDEKNRKSIADLVKIPERLYPVGRLDRNSEGLLLLTNDGGFANNIAHPSKHITKSYRVSVDVPEKETLSEDQIAKLSESIEIDGKMTAPATVYVKENIPGRAIIIITINEGRNRQIRRLCEHAALNVARLKRVGIGPLKMGMLRPGEWRELTKDELRAIRNAIS